LYSIKWFKLNLLNLISVENFAVFQLTITRIDEPLLLPLDGQNSVGLDGDFFSQLAVGQILGGNFSGVPLLSDLSPSPAESIVALAVDLMKKFSIRFVFECKLAVLEAMILTGWQRPKQTLMLHWNLMLSLLGNLNALKLAMRPVPSASYSHSPKIAGSDAHPFSSVTMYSFSTLSSIVFAMQLLANPPYMPANIFSVNFTPVFKSVYGLTLWLYVHSQDKIVSNLSGIDLASVLSDNLHDASWRRSSVGDGSSGGQHGNVEAEGHVLLPSCVHALDVIGLRLVRDQLGMFLYDKHEACFSL
jgi:hypothetical protein